MTSLWQRIVAMFDAMSSGQPKDAEEAMKLAESQLSYGLYDKAERTLKSALDGEPNRADVEVKLLFVYFVWGKAADFLTLAQQVHAAHSGLSEWPNVAAMGRQLCPGESLFL